MIVMIIPFMVCYTMDNYEFVILIINQYLIIVLIDVNSASNIFLKTEFPELLYGTSSVYGTVIVYIPKYRNPTERFMAEV